ncbi:F-box domain-containing protein [Citrus sinensis]|uniref:putative F-box protein At3g28280 isoform X1 n=1 Tax=Citrus sinensis TaxID=2711 RepID=UPI0021999C46|nr:putative F-box protein At3g28280 isoform X1 [Citrus sinensis]KAH9725134.1 F-box domain-containing protein [Citrus sinensis]
MAKSIGSRNANLLRLVEERALSKQVEGKKAEEQHEEQQETVLPYLPKDCMLKILIRLPLQSLSSTKFVCKPWYNMITSDNFVDVHFRRSESVLIFQKPVVSRTPTSYQPEKSNTFSVEASLQPRPSYSSIFDNRVRRKFYIQFMEFKGGKIETERYNLCCLGKIRATCNGLILLDNDLKKGGLIVMNPVTRKLIALPAGTLCRPHNESFGFALNEVTGDYKVVHLFRDELGYVSCETLNLGTRKWREVNGPAFGVFGWFGYRPVSAIGALHWVPQINHSDCIVSMEVNSEKFQTISLPKSCTTHDGIVEMGGFLCFVAHDYQELNIDIWILKGLCNEAWTKYHRIMRSVIDMVPHFCLRISGDMVFRRDEDGSFYAYDFTHKVMTKIEREKGWFPPSSSCLPHVNSLVSWEKGQNVCD